MTYVCDLCDAKFKTEAACRACENQSTVGDLGLAVGDVITFDSFEFGWHDGSDLWVRFMEPRRRHGVGDARLLVYIVTAITTRNHRYHYHVETLAMAKGRGGYTNNWHFTRFTKVPESEATALREEATRAGLIGLTFGDSPVM